MAHRHLHVHRAGACAMALRLTCLAHLVPYRCASVTQRRRYATADRRADARFTDPPLLHDKSAAEDGFGGGGQRQRPLQPRALKASLDQYVIGQDAAKRTLAVACFNHALRHQHTLDQRLAAQEEISRAALQRQQQQQQQQMTRRREEDGEVGKDEEVNPGQPVERGGEARITNTDAPPETATRRTSSSSGGASADNNFVIDVQREESAIEKSNVLLFGPTGSGKTLLARTLARLLDVPIAISDCTPFTQAGYVGEDVEVCVQRLLQAANWDVTRAERGIIVLDEVDKIARRADAMAGKDVSGEGVQQALLKILEGTVLQISDKGQRGAAAASSPSSAGAGAGAGIGAAGAMDSRGRTTAGLGLPPNGAAATGAPVGPPPGMGKGEIHTIDTSNILFILTGAFVGLDKIVTDRVAKSSIGFNSIIRPSATTARQDDDDLAEEDTFDSALDDDNAGSSGGASAVGGLGRLSRSADGDMDDALDTRLHPKDRPFFSQARDVRDGYKPLELVEPRDLVSFGLIPELIGRCPVFARCDKLSEEDLLRVLTEPRNALVRQFELLFRHYGVDLHLTTPALRRIARAALRQGTGARGLRRSMEVLLLDAMFETPGSGVRYCLVTEATAAKTSPCIYLSRGQAGIFHSVIASEEERDTNRQAAKQARIENRNRAQQGRSTEDAAVDSDGQAEEETDTEQRRSAAGGSS